MGSTEWGRAPVDELVAAVVADLEEVLAGFGEAVTTVETLRPRVLRPHPKPRGTRTYPVEDELDEGGTQVRLLVAGKEIEAFELGVLGKRIKDGPRFLGGQSLFALRLDDSKIRGFQH